MTKSRPSGPAAPVPNTNPTPADKFQRVERTLFLADVAGWMKSFRDHSDEDMVRFADSYYGVCAKAVEEADGLVLKFIGDACLAVFASDTSGVKGALEAAAAIDTGLRELAQRYRLTVGLGVKIHRATVCEGVFGVGELARLDVLGRSVNELFLMSGGDGVTLSEAAMEALSVTEQGQWQAAPAPLRVYRKRP